MRQKVRLAGRVEVKSELNDMIRKNVWTIINEDEVPMNKCPFGMKWVFKVKTDGRYRARLVALGYRQIPGIDFTDLHTPVMSEVTFRILLLMKMSYEWHMTKVDIEKAFLDSPLDEDLYIKVPKGINEVVSVGEKMLPSQ